jgi:hypothetical protein
VAFSRAFLGVVLLAACGADPKPGADSPGAAAVSVPAPPAEPVAVEDAGAPDKPPLPPVPKGAASFSVHLPPGSRMPVTLVGRVVHVQPPRGESGLDAWSEVALEGGAAMPQTFYLLQAPDTLTLPFAPGDRISAQIDCRKGGWHRVCDATVRDAQRRLVLIVSASGDHRIASGWKIERGPVATSEIRPGAQKSIEHTYALVIGREGRSIPVSPHEWHRFEVRGESWLVHGYEVEWEGVRPPDAVNHRAFVLLRER